MGTLMEPLMLLDLDCWGMLKPLLVIRRMKFHLSSTICQLLPKWQPWPKPAETSGGLLICLPREQAAAYCKDIEKQEGYQAWIIGIVEKGQRTARIIDKPRVIEVPAKEKEGELW